jgi:hypothetical protein
MEQQQADHIRGGLQDAINRIEGNGGSSSKGVSLVVLVVRSVNVFVSPLVFV